MARRDKLADANERERELKNRIHAYDQEVVLPLRSRVAELERENKALNAKLDRATHLEQLYRGAWSSIVRLQAAVLPCEHRLDVPCASCEMRRRSDLATGKV